MALTINNFWGAETGGLEECSAISGAASVSVGSALSGGYGYDFGATAQTYTFSPFESVADAASDYICGFKIFATDYSTATNLTFLEFLEAAAVCASFVLAANGDLIVRDALDATIRTITAPFTDSTEHFVEIYWQHVASGTIEVFIDGVSQGSDSAQDLTDGGTFDGIIFTQAATGPTAGELDDLYFMSGATAATDRLGGCEVFAYRSTVNTTTPDWTQVGVDNGLIQSGTWERSQQDPFDDAQSCSYVTKVTHGGGLDTNDAGGSAGTGGPNTDANVDGDSNIKAQKGVWRVQRNTGSPTTHFGLMGNTGTAIGTGDRTIDFDPTTAYVTYYDVRETNLPLSTEYLRIGFETDAGGQRFVCADMLPQILHVPSAAVVASFPPYNPYKVINNFLVR